MDGEWWKADLQRLAVFLDVTQRVGLFDAS